MSTNEAISKPVNKELVRSEFIKLDFGFEEFGSMKFFVVVKLDDAL